VDIFIQAPEPLLLHLFLWVSDSTRKDREHRFGFWQAGRVINPADSGIRAAFLKLQAEYDIQSASLLTDDWNTDRVVEACAKMFPPIGFFSLDAYGPAAASGLDITWLE
jgi:hypothetical protein